MTDQTPDVQPASHDTPSISNDEKKGMTEKTEHVETVRTSDSLDGNGSNLHKKAGIAVIQQQHTIPITGERKPTTKWEYIFFCIFYFSNNGAPIGSNGGPLRQKLLSLEFPSGMANWGGQTLPINSMLLDITGIQFAVQLFLLLSIGPYADYGNWRPYIMITFQTILYICQFAMIGMSRASQWQAAQAFYVIGQIAANMATAFYAATFPGLVRDLPKLIKSEKDVALGAKTPEEHADLDMYERSKLYNLCNITGSALVVITYAIAVGISAAIGYSTDEQLIKAYRVLMGYFGALTFICTVPFFIVQQKRPGQKIPEGVKWWLIGPTQVWSAAKCVKDLRQCLLYLIAYFMLQETFGTYFQVNGILQNEVVHYSPLINNAMGLVSDLAGGSGTVFMLLLQKKFRFSVKAGVFYGACMTLVPSFWGALGLFNNNLGFHHVWAFWAASAWNFQTAAWGAYSVTMISEVVPAPKSFMFFALFNTVNKTSGLIGPFVSAAIIKRAGGRNSACYWFIFGMGLVGVLTLWFVDTDKAKRDNQEYLAREARELYGVEETDIKAQKEKIVA